MIEYLVEHYDGGASGTFSEKKHSSAPGNGLHFSRPRGQGRPVRISGPGGGLWFMRRSHTGGRPRPMARYNRRRVTMGVCARQPRLADDAPLGRAAACSLRRTPLGPRFANPGPHRPPYIRPTNPPPPRISRPRPSPPAISPPASSNGFFFVGPARRFGKSAGAAGDW